MYRGPRIERLDPFQYAPYPLASQSTGNIPRIQYQPQPRSGGFSYNQPNTSHGSLPNLNQRQAQPAQQPTQNQQNNMEIQPVPRPQQPNPQPPTRATRSAQVEEDFEPPLHSTDFSENYMG